MQVNRRCASSRRGAGSWPSTPRSPGRGQITVSGHREQSSDSGVRAWESRAPAAAQGGRSPHQVPRELGEVGSRSSGTQERWAPHATDALQHQGFTSPLRSLAP